VFHEADFFEYNGISLFFTGSGPAGILHFYPGAIATAFLCENGAGEP
jgi:hypothetical protein